jgi:hypothetical protein
MRTRDPIKLLVARGLVEETAGPDGHRRHDRRCANWHYLTFDMARRQLPTHVGAPLHIDEITHSGKPESE